MHKSSKRGPLSSTLAHIEILSIMHRPHGILSTFKLLVSKRPFQCDFWDFYSFKHSRLRLHIVGLKFTPYLPPPIPIYKGTHIEIHTHLRGTKNYKSGKR